MPPPKPYKVITVDATPQGASRLVRKLADDVKSQYTLIHCDNATKIDEVESLVSLYRPDILFSASTWSPAQSAQIKSIARKIVPGLRFYAIPREMRAEQLRSQFPKIAEGNLGLH